MVKSWSHVPASKLESAVKRFDYPLRKWWGNNTFQIEVAAEKFEYNMLVHPVIETKLDSVNKCRLIFDTGCVGMLILDKKNCEKKRFDQSILTNRNDEVGVEFKA